MRLWSLHPRYLDRQGLLALWRESLLAQKVLAGRTKGYRNHPQLDRFKGHPRPLDAMGFYLDGIRNEAERRGYSFDKKRILRPGRRVGRIRVTAGQVRFETWHLSAKLGKRDKPGLERFRKVAKPDLHPVFVLVKGPREPWEKTGL
jgi:hypothetical protein